MSVASREHIDIDHQSVPSATEHVGGIIIVRPPLVAIVFSNSILSIFLLEILENPHRVKSSLNSDFNELRKPKK